MSDATTSWRWNENNKSSQVGQRGEQNKSGKENKPDHVICLDLPFLFFLSFLFFIWFSFFFTSPSGPMAQFLMCRNRTCRCVNREKNILYVKNTKKKRNMTDQGGTAGRGKGAQLTQGRRVDHCEDDWATTKRDWDWDWQTGGADGERGTEKRLLVWLGRGPVSQ